MFKKIAIFISFSLSFIGFANAESGDIEAGKAKAGVCAACHGMNGVSVIPANPSLAGQVSGYIEAQLKAFKSGERKNPIMMGQVQMLNEQDMKNLDAYYSSLAPANPVVLADADREQAELAFKIYRGGDVKRGVAACMGCHGPSGAGVPNNYPRVAGLNSQYLEQQLQAYKNGERVGYNGIMKDIAFKLTNEEIKQLSLLMSGLQK